MDSSFQLLCSEVEQIRQERPRNKRGVRFPREIQKRALAFLTQGLSSQEICEGLGILKSTFSYWRNRHGFPLKKERGHFQELRIGSLGVGEGLCLKTIRGSEISRLTLDQLKALLSEELI